MSENSLKLTRAPIIEAIVDIDCDMPPKFDLAEHEAAAKEAFSEPYPMFEAQVSENHKIELQADKSLQHRVKRGLAAFRFRNGDGRQLVQVRAQGFSFNRLAPYTTLDDYLAEIERCWKLYAALTGPTQIQSIKLRYINRILLPLFNSEVMDLADFFEVIPQLPSQSNLELTGFLNQYGAVEVDTGNLANIVLTVQEAEAGQLPIIFDISVIHQKPGEIEDWPWILSKIMSLRSLKNRIFQNTLTQQCLELFQTSD